MSNFRQNKRVEGSLRKYCKQPIALVSVRLFLQTRLASVDPGEGRSLSVQAESVRATMIQIDALGLVSLNGSRDQSRTDL